jgi:predicted RNA-binding protein with PIN domain
VLYSRAGQTADDLIERAAARFRAFGEVLVVTDDIAERDTVMHFGAHAASCGNFIADYASVAGDLGREIKELNSRERRRFNRPRT